MMQRRFGMFAAGLTTFILAASAGASDHLDSPASGNDLATDITDFFAFTQSDRLVLIMDVHPQATQASKFSDKAVYSFRVRPDAKDDARELRLDCTFDDAAVQNVSCTAYAFDTKTRHVTTTMASGPIATGQIAPVSDVKSNGMRVFAGLRADPFFLDVGLGASFKTGQWSFVGQNIVQNLNALSLVVELNVAGLLPHSPIVRTAAEITKKKVSQ